VMKTRVNAIRAYLLEHSTTLFAAMFEQKISIVDYNIVHQFIENTCPRAQPGMQTQAYNRCFIRTQWSRRMPLLAHCQKGGVKLGAQQIAILFQFIIVSFLILSHFLCSTDYFNVFKNLCLKFNINSTINVINVPANEKDVDTLANIIKEATKIDNPLFATSPEFSTIENLLFGDEKLEGNDPNPSLDNPLFEDDIITSLFKTWDNSEFQSGSGCVKITNPLTGRLIASNGRVAKTLLNDHKLGKIKLPRKILQIIKSNH